MNKKRYRWFTISMITFFVCICSAPGGSQERATITLISGEVKEGLMVGLSDKGVTLRSEGNDEFYLQEEIKKEHWDYLRIMKQTNEKFGYSLEGKTDESYQAIIDLLEKQEYGKARSRLNQWAARTPRDIKIPMTRTLINDLEAQNDPLVKSRILLEHSTQLHKAINNLTKDRKKLMGDPEDRIRKANKELDRMLKDLEARTRKKNIQ